MANEKIKIEQECALKEISQNINKEKDDVNQLDD